MVLFKRKNKCCGVSLGLMLPQNPKKIIYLKKKSEYANFARHRMRNKKNNHLLCLADTTGILLRNILDSAF